MKNFISTILITALATVSFGQLLPNNDATDIHPEITDMVHYLDYEGPMLNVINERHQATVVFADLADDPEQNVFLMGQKCTGTLIAPNLVLTASHCTLDDNFPDYVVFGVDGKDMAGNHIFWQAYPILNILEEGSADSQFTDYAIIEIGGNPLADLAIEGLGEPTSLKAYTPELGDPVAIIGNPQFHFEPDIGNVEGTNPYRKRGDSGVITYHITHKKGENNAINYQWRYGFRHGIFARSESSGSGLLDGFGNLIGIHNALPYILDQQIPAHEVVSGMGGGAFSLSNAILVSSTLQTMTSTAGISVDADEEVAQIAVFVTAGDEVYKNKYIRTHSNADFRKYQTNKHFISVEAGEEIRMTGFVGPVSQSGHRISGIKIEEVVPDIIGHTYQTVPATFIPASSDFLASGSYVMGNHPVFVTFVFDDCPACIPRAKSNADDANRSEIPNKTFDFNDDTLFPNPSNSSFKWINKGNISPVKASIRDINGSLIKEINIALETTSIEFGASLKSGLYILEINFKDGSTREYKLIKN